MRHILVVKEKVRVGEAQGIRFLSFALEKEG